MSPVVLVRPVWWTACRSVRFVTALVLIALLLGAGGTGMGSAAPVGTAEIPPTVTAARSSAVETAPPAGDFVDDDLPQRLDDDLPERLDVVDPAPADDLLASGDLPDPADDLGAAPAGPSVAADGLPDVAVERSDVSPAAAVRAAGVLVRPDGTAGRPGVGPGIPPAGDGYVGAIGSRAPPLG